MSGQITSNVFRGSGVIAATAGGLNWVSTVVTASTLTAEAGNGYWIDTTSNTCTITLPSSAEAGDQIVFIDYARTWGTNKIIIDSNGLNYQGESDIFTVEYNTDGETLNIVYVDATQGWIPLNDDDVTDAPVQPPTQKGVTAYGEAGGMLSLSNLISSSGVVATDTTGVGTARYNLGASGYGGDKGIFAYGGAAGPTFLSMSNLVSNAGVVATDTTGVGTQRQGCRAAIYGYDKGIFAYGVTNYSPEAHVSVSNLVSTSGVISTDVTGVGTARTSPGATEYGFDKAIFGYGHTLSPLPYYASMSNLVSNTGVVATDTAGVGTALTDISATGYGTTGLAMFFYGEVSSATMVNTINRISNTGVVGATITGAGTARRLAPACRYGGDKAITAFGYVSAYSINTSNLISSSGVIATDTSGVGTARRGGEAVGYSFST